MTEQITDFSFYCIFMKCPKWGLYFIGMFGPRAQKRDTLTGHRTRGRPRQHNSEPALYADATGKLDISGILPGGQMDYTVN